MFLSLTESPKIRVVLSLLHPSFFGHNNRCFLSRISNSVSTRSDPVFSAIIIVLLSIQSYLHSSLSSDDHHDDASTNILCALGPMPSVHISRARSGYGIGFPRIHGRKGKARGNPRETSRYARQTRGTSTTEDECATHVNFHNSSRF